ncbi:DUF434 domain-containing protein [Terrisporobacter sp.]
MRKVSRRGYEESDKRFFSPKELIRLKKAKEEVEYLISRDYKLDPVVTFVSNRYQFSNRQRDCLKRAVCTLDSLNLRKSKRLSIEEINQQIIYIDGFNLIITIEVALSDGTLIVGSDENIRDLAGLRGTYKIIDKTEKALELIGKCLDDYNCKKAVFYLDSPVSNSGNLKCEILESAKNWTTEVEVNLVNNADVILERMDNVVTSDAVIIDKCESYFNLNKKIIEKYIDESNLINLNK